MKLNHLLDDIDVRTYMTNRLSAVGGVTVESLTRRIFKYVLTNEVAALYNWKGRDKLSFEKTTLKTVIFVIRRRRSRRPNLGRPRRMQTICEQHHHSLQHSRPSKKCLNPRTFRGFSGCKRHNFLSSAFISCWRRRGIVLEAIKDQLNRRQTLETIIEASELDLRIG